MTGSLPRGAVANRRSKHDSQEERTPCTVIWVDARAATIVRWAGEPVVERIVSDVPVHRRSTGHVRHDTGMLHGGGGAPQTAGEPRRLEHVRRYLDEVAARVPDDQDLEILGSGTMRYRLAVTVRHLDERHGRQRELRTDAAPRLTEAQLVARARELNGDPPARGYRR